MAIVLRGRFRAGEQADDAGTPRPPGSGGFSIAITSPAPGATVTGTITVTGTTTRVPLAVTISIDGGPFVDATISGTSWSYVLDTTLYPSGLATILAKGTDDSGQIATASEAVSFTAGGILPPSWRTVIHSTFDVAGVLDSPWFPYNFPAPVSTWGWYRPSHVVVSGGTCKLIHSYDPTGPAAGTGRPGYDNATGAGWYQGTIKLTPDGDIANSYIDYRITTRMRITSTPGIFSHRNLPLFWPWDGGLRNRGEQDVMEGQADPADLTPGNFHVFLHYGADTNQDLSTSLAYPGFDASQWHTYRVTRLNQRLTVEIDAAQVLDHQYTTTELRNLAAHPVYQQNDGADLLAARAGATTGSETIEIDSVLIEVPA